MQLKLAGKLKDVRGIIFGEMARLPAKLHQDYTLEEVVLRSSWRSGNSGGIRPAFWARFACEYHIANRRESAARSRRASQPENSGVRDDREMTMQAQTHSPDRHLRNGDGFARGHAARARLSRHRIGCGIVSADVDVSRIVGHSCRATVCRSESESAARSRGRGQRTFSRQCRTGTACSTSAFRSARCRRFCTMNFS